MTGAQTTRLASLQIAMFVLVGLWVLVQEAGSATGTFVFGLTGLVFGIAIVLRARQTDVTRTGASLLVPIMGILLLAGIGLTGLEIANVLLQSQSNIQVIAQSVIRDVGINIAAGIAVFGTVGTISRGIGDQGVSRLVPTAFGSLLTVSVFFLALVYFRSALLSSADIPTIQVSELSDQVLQPGNPGAELVTFWLLLIVAFLLARFMLSAIPIVELTPRTYEDELKQGRDWVRSWLGFTAFLLGMIGVFAVLLFAPEPGKTQRFVPQLRQTLGPSISEPLFATVQAENLRFSLIAASLVFAGISFVFKVLEYLTGSITSTIRRFLPSVIGGMLAIVIATLATSQVSTLVARIPPAQQQPVKEILLRLGPFGMLVGGMGVAIAGVIVVLMLVSFAGGLRFIPLRGGGGALAAAGLAIGAIALAIVETAPVTVLILVTLSILTWNTGERGVRTRSELGASPPLTLETLHSLGGVVIAVPAATFAWWIYTRPLSSISATEGTVLGVVGSLLALSLLIGFIKG